MATQKLTVERLRQILVDCSHIFTSTERLAISSAVLEAAVERFKDNSDLRNVLAKVTLVNTLYSTQIYDTWGMSRHIVACRIDERLRDGDHRVVESIRRGHRILIAKSEKEWDFYSFATKYAAFHRPDKYPLYDNLVGKTLAMINRNAPFCSPFSQGSLRHYGQYVSVIDALSTFTGLETMRYKQLDRGLWVYAKYLLDRSRLRAEEIEAVESAVLRGDG